MPGRPRTSGARGPRDPQLLLRALDIDPRNALAHYNLGVLYDEAGETALAMEHDRSFLDHATVNTPAGPPPSACG